MLEIIVLMNSFCLKRQPQIVIIVVLGNFLRVKVRGDEYRECRQGIGYVQRTANHKREGKERERETCVYPYPFLFYPLHMYV